MTPQTASPALSVFTAAIAKMNGAGMPDENGLANGGEAETAPFRLLIESLLGQAADQSTGAATQGFIPEILADEEKCSLDIELAAILPFVKAFNLDAGEGKDAAVAPVAAAEDTPVPELLAETDPFALALPGAAQPTAITAVAEGMGGAQRQETAAFARAMSAASGKTAQEWLATKETIALPARESGDGFAAIQHAPPTPVASQPAPTAVAQHAVAVRVGADGWSEAFSQRIVWMANRTESQANLVLTPPQMGRIEVNLAVSGEQATASFVSANPAVREALEAALPRLREALAEAGIQLGHTQVGAENPRHAAQQQNSGENSAVGRPLFDDDSRNMGGHGARSDELAGLAGVRTVRGLVDIFA